MESHPPLATRFVPPRLSQRLVPRDALVQHLHAARHCRLTLLCAPAGYGKSIAMAQWRKRLVAEGARVAWLTLGAEDDSPHALCASLHASFRQAGLALRWQPSASVDAGTVVRDLIGALAGAAGELYLMLDEADHLRRPAALAVLQSLLDAPLPDLHVVVAARRECALALGRLQGAGQLNAAGHAELAFSLAETQAFLARRANAPCRAGGAALDAAVWLHEDTEGWAAGLELIAGQSGPHLADGGTDPVPCPPALQDYVNEAVLPDVPEDLLHWAAQVSLLRRFNAALAAHVTGDPDSTGRLAQARQLGLFLQPERAPGGHGWWRLHAQFGAALRRRRAAYLRDAAELHRRAATWLAQAGHVADALPHAMLCADDAPVIAVLGAVAPDLPAVSQLREFLRWLERRPAGRAIDHPLLWLTAAWACVVSARPREALDWLRRWQESGAGDAGTIARHAGLITATLAVQRDDLPGALAIFQALPDGPMGGPALEHMRMALAARCGSIAGRRAPPVAPARGDTSELALMRSGTAAATAWLEGHAREALRLGSQALAAAERAHGWRSIAACLCAVTVASALYEQDQPHLARERLAGRFGLVRFATPDVLIEAALCRARLQACGDAVHEALAGLAEAESVFHQRGLPRGVAWMLAEQVRLALSVDDRRHAARLQEALDDLSRCHVADHPRDHEIAAAAALSRARAMLAASDPGQALVSLETCRSHAEACGKARLVACAELLQALAHEDLGQAGAARTSLASALAAGERLGLVRTFADEGERVRNLLTHAAREAPGGHAGRLAVSWQAGTTRDTTSGTTREPASQADAPPPAPLVASPGQIGSALGNVLTRREREILALLEQSMTNKHIALVLNLSVDTVKWNMRQIFSKLGVSRRYDAILKARSAAQLAAGNVK
ncbi:HTH-type transcriptional regulator MalT [Cupriavidus yeoncheonensis]|uniref:HTH-type transcriptional regulator MalT n=1 Tax=Cupriavidus yeoncheonensis TaxID=1462994 RepID=A0A916MVZ3_9BURK|nr:LuxR C-terminal-related transcriptional regulator [Cupriavidus yeoncheonensis]CAG2146644.1 HTH-type transcriptional regulator MalT [Cupriavidus yeoncheonensis]